MPNYSDTKVHPRNRTEKYNIQGVGVGEISTDQFLTLTDERNGGENTRWRWQVRHHVQAGTGFSAQRQTYRGGFGEVYGFYHVLVNGVPRLRYSRSIGDLIPLAFPSVLPSSTGYADNVARSKLYKFAKEAQTSFRGLTFLGELTETLRMIRNPARSLRRGLDTYVQSATKRTRRVKSKPALNRIVGDLWLEHAFGWAPFISDVKSAGAALNQRLERYSSSYAKVSGEGKEENDYQDYSLPQIQTYLNRWRWAVHGKTTVSVRYKSEIRSVCPNPVQADMQLFGVSWTEVVPTAWELVPWSFLVDYFSNIGKILDAWTVRKSDFCWTVRTDRKTSSRTVGETYPTLYLSGSGWNSSLPTGQTWSYYPASCEWKSVARSLPTEVGLPSLTWRIPGLGKQWINMSALANARRSFRRSRF